MERKQRWSDLTPRQRAAIVAAGTIEVVLTTVAIVDLSRRPRAQVRGSKQILLRSLDLSENRAGLGSVSLDDAKRVLNDFLVGRKPVGALEAQAATADDIAVSHRSAVDNLVVEVSALRAAHQYLRANTQ